MSGPAVSGDYRATLFWRFQLDRIHSVHSSPMTCCSAIRIGERDHSINRPSSYRSSRAACCRSGVGLPGARSSRLSCQFRYNWAQKWAILGSNPRPQSYSGILPQAV